jgi:hypothetical protein
VTNIYKRLLKDESYFSLSYGFERYINAFRNFKVSEKKILKAKKAIEEMKDVYQGVVENGAPEIIKYIHGELEILMQLLERNEYKNVEEVEQLFLDRKKEKYSDYNDNMDKGVLAYFRVYYNAKKEILDLKVSYDELVPFLEEIKLKYSEDY